MGEENYDDSGR